jgi:hypothetical protein
MADDQRTDAGMQTIGNAPAIQSIQAVALYDPADGRIVHMHHTIRFEGADERREEEQVQQATETARRLGHDVQRIKSLHVRDFKMSPRAYRVDVGRQVLVEEPPPPLWDRTPSR